ncbi:LVIVD repeat-containing protein [Halobaculum sp. MBLA0143]|uniref:LVIVD repeat-containing protein n=1 Tax=Halobaculum sp. MBLA0143 TaxID=3079933 RepID=UPI003524AFDF
MRRRDAIRAGLAAVGVGVVGRRAGARTETPTPQGRLPVEGAKEAVVSPDGRTAFLATTDGYATVDLREPSAPALLARRRDPLAETDTGPMTDIYDVKLADDGETLAVVGPANYVAGESTNGVLFVDVSEPAAPTPLAFHRTSFPIHNCVFADGHVYLTGNGARTVDGVTRNELVVVAAGAEPREVGRWSLVDHDERWAAVNSGFRVLHDVWVRDGLAVLAHWDAGTYLLDVSDPATPTHLGTVPAVTPAELTDDGNAQYTSTPGNHHYVTTDPENELLGIGGESWAVERDGELRGGPSGIDLYDVSDPTAPTRLSRIAPPTSADPTFRGTWTTAHNFTIRAGTLYSSWYHGGVKRHDLSDPTAPRELSWWVDPTAARFWAATPAVSGEFFLASSMGTETGAAGLWTFPETDGTGGRPAALTATDTGEQTQTTTASAARAATASPTPTASRTPSDREPRTATATRSETTESGETAASAPGFGAVAAACGLGVVAWRRLRSAVEP